MATITAEQAKNILENIAKEEPLRFPIAVQTLIINAYQRLDKYEMVLRELAKESKEIREVFKQMAGEVAAPAATEVAGEEAPVEAAAPAVRIGADGEPVTGEQAEAEALMDAAAGPHPLAQNAAPARRNGNGGGKRRAPAGPPPVRLGADGKPLDPEQAAAEAAMDEAISGG